HSTALDATFGALADPTRRGILAHLARRPRATVGELARPFDVSLPAISRHLRVLETAGLLARDREGRVHRCRVLPGPIREARDWLERYPEFWESRLDSLEKFLTETEPEEDEPWIRPRRRVSPSDARSPRRAKGSSARGRRPN